MAAELMIRIRANAQEAQQAFRQSADGLRQIQRETGAVSKAMEVSSFNTANLAAQFQDIGVMMAAGQNPLQLALQQGTQISAVLGPMGAGAAVRSLGAAFMSLINPVSLVTIGTIAGGAALVQWLTRSKEGAEGAVDAFDQLSEAVAGYRRALDATDADDIAKTFGAQSAAAREFLDIQRQIAEAEAQRALNTATRSAGEAFGAGIMALSPMDARRLRSLEDAVAWQRRLQDQAILGGLTPEQESALQHLNDVIASSEQFLIASQAARDEIAQLQRDFGLTAEETDRLVEAMAALGAAQGGQEQADAAKNLARYIYEATDGLENADDAANALYQQLLDVVLKGLEFAAIEGMSEPLAEAAEEARKLAEELQKALNSAGALERTHPRLGTIIDDRESMGGTQSDLGDIRAAVDGGILDLIAYAEGTDRGRSYNETLGYGAFTGGAVDLVNMTLAEVRALQRQMLAHPDNNLNSSAVGRYQIVGDTLDGLVRSLGLDWNQQFTPDLQDRMALQLIRENGGGVDAIRSQWEGVNGGRVNDTMILQALGSSQIPTVDPDVAAFTEEAARAADAAEQAYRRLTGSMDAATAAQQAFADGVAVLDAALAAGRITQGEYDAGLDMLRQRLEQQEQALNAIAPAAQRGADAMANLFLSMGQGADGAKQALAQLLMQIASVQMTRAFRGLAGDGGGVFGFLGDLLSLSGGGYTGSGPRDAVAGVVHGGEYVFSANAVERIGLSALEGLHRGYRDGGLVSPAGLSGPQEIVAGMSGQSGIHITASIDETGQLYVRQVAAQEAARMGVQVTAGVRSQIMQYQRNPRRT